MIIHVMGASGSGTSTMGEFLAEKLDFNLIESDFYKWQQTDPPFQKMRPIEESNSLLMEQINRRENLIITGSLHANPVTFPYIDLIIYLSCPTRIRLKRVKNRDILLGRNSLEAEGDIKENFLGFLELAKNYNKKDLNIRSKSSQNHVIKMSNAKVIKIQTNRKLSKIQEKILKKVENYVKNQ